MEKITDREIRGKRAAEDRVTGSSLLARPAVMLRGEGAALGIIGMLVGAPLAVAVALAWFAHIGMDRLAGYGLKYPTDFKDTHLQWV